jgi:aldehyde dehydrogenase (NAD+)
LFVHESIYDSVFENLKSAYQSIFDNKKVGSPLDPTTLVGPLIDSAALADMQRAIDQIRPYAKEVFGGTPHSVPGSEGGSYVLPALVKLDTQTDTVSKETFAPILYVMPYTTLEQVMKLHNAVPQGLSSAIMTTDVREAEYFKRYSDCGIANVNIGTSGAEIGGAFGGEKETGGGRQSGSDSWKAYMRRQTSTCFYGFGSPPLAQGIKFEI